MTDLLKIYNLIIVVISAIIYTNCFIFVLLTQKTAEIKHRIPRREWSIIFKIEIIHYFKTFLHFCWPQIIQILWWMVTYLLSVLLRISQVQPVTARELWHRCPFTQAWIALLLCTRYTNLPIHTTHIRLQLTPLGRISCSNLIMIKGKWISDYYTNLI